MPRSIWNGTITFGLAVVPIKLYSATESKSVHFHEVHVTDGAPVEHRRICPKDDREVPADQIAKGYEVSEDEYVVLSKDEIKAAASDRGKIIHLEEFVAADEIDPVFFDKTYYVGARDDHEVYGVLVEALRRSGRAGIGRFAFHDREYLVALRAVDDAALALHTLRFADEVVPADDLELPKTRKPAANEIKMADRLVDLLERDFNPGDYDDTYRESVLDLIKTKAAGKEIDLSAQEEPAHGDDLGAALEASLSGARS
jgi:DNA end-binding protein Ku